MMSAKTLDYANKILENVLLRKRNLELDSMTGLDRSEKLKALEPVEAAARLLVNFYAL